MISARARVTGREFRGGTTSVRPLIMACAANELTMADAISLTEEMRFERSEAFSVEPEASVLLITMDA